MSPRRLPPARLLAIALGALALAIASGGCGPEHHPENVSMAAIQEIPDSAWAALDARRIFFGHQSVGGNIMEGVATLLREDPKIGLRIAEGRDAFPDTGGVFAHWDIGKNGYPREKTDAFAALVEGPLAGKLNVAFHKYCFADIIDTTDVTSVFEHYRATMARLRSEQPNVRFVHVTTPLVRVQAGPKALLKKLMGRRPARYASNMARERFNDLLRRTYEGKEPVFDLAAVESTRPDGSRETIEFRGQRSYALVPGYSSDGSHLNPEGERRLAEALLVFLARRVPVN